VVLYNCGCGGGGIHVLVLLDMVVYISGVGGGKFLGCWRWLYILMVMEVVLNISSCKVSGI